MIKHDCLVDEVSPLVARHSLDDGHHFLGGVKEAGFGVLLFASAALAGATPLRLFFIVLFHNSKNMLIYLTTLQRYENNLILPYFFKIILRKMQDFSMLKSFNYVWSM